MRKTATFPERKATMKTQTKQMMALVLGALLLYGGWLAWRAHQNLVTLNVRNMEVKKVIDKIEWQTWENIYAHKDLQGLVTLDVHKMPLEEVLRLVGDQVGARYNVFYPLYSSRKSYKALEKSLRGEIDPSQNGWTNLEGRVGFGFRGGPGGGGSMFGGFGGPGGGPFGGGESNQQARVSLDIQGKDLAFATLAFSRFAQTRVVPDDAASPLITMSVSDATVPKAVSKLAKSARRSWTTCYTLRGFGGPGGPGGFGGRGGDFAMLDGETNGGPRGFARAELTDEQREEMRKQREAMEEELKKALPDAERQRLEAAQQQREQQMKELESLTPEQRRARFSQMMGANGGMDRRSVDRLKNSTPAQRAMQQRQMTEMRKRFQEQGGQPGRRGGQGGQGGPGGPGGGPPGR